MHGKETPYEDTQVRILSRLQILNFKIMSILQVGNLIVIFIILIVLVYGITTIIKSTTDHHNDYESRMKKFKKGKGPHPGLDY
jgi:Na+-transporting methylmalonyl-CoA/oxaloacetate decarboxylase gamma subunit